MSVYRLRGRVRLRSTQAIDCIRRLEVGPILLHQRRGTDTDQLHLARAIELAESGRGRGEPESARRRGHRRATARSSARASTAGYGGPHAEVEAIDAAAEADLDRRDAVRVAGALLPPGQDAAVHRRDPRRPGIGRVVVASDDPTEKASGRGLGILRDEGIEVVVADGELAAPRAAAQPAVPQARAHRAARGCCSSRR